MRYAKISYFVVLSSLVFVVSTLIRHMPTKQIYVVSKFFQLVQNPVDTILRIILILFGPVVSLIAPAANSFWLVFSFVNF